MSASDGIAVGICQLVDTLQSTFMEIGVNCLVGRQETSVLAISGKQVHQVGALDNGLELAVIWTIVQIVA